LWLECCRKDRSGLRILGVRVLLGEGASAIEVGVDARVGGVGEGGGTGRERERAAGRGETEIGEGAIALLLLRLDRLHLPYIYSPYRTCVPSNYGRYPYRSNPPFLNKPNSYLNQSPNGGGAQYL